MDALHAVIDANSKQHGSIDISIVMPCLNEARTVASCVEAALEGIAATGLRGEVIVADNGSTDGSQQIAERVGATVVPVARRGYGAALQEGFKAARGRLLVMGDADLSYDFREIPALVNEQIASGADMVVGDRLGGRIDPGAMPWTHRWIGNPLISFTIRTLFGVSVTDCYCGLRLITREAHRRLRLNSTSMEYALQMIIEGSLVGFRFAQVPIALHVDGRDRAPHLRTVRDGYRSFRFLFQHAPITAYGVPGALGIFSGVGLLAREAWLEFRGVTETTATVVLAGALFQLGWLLIVLGIIARVFVAGFLGGRADTQLRRFFRIARLESAVAVSAIVLAAGLGLTFTFGRLPALMEFGLSLCVIAIGTVLAALVVSLIGRAMPTQRFAEPQAAAQSVPVMAPADPHSRQNTDHSLATQEALSNAVNYNEWLAESVRDAWQGSARVLDVGCSIGNLTHILADRLKDDGSDSHVTGVEIIPEAAERFHRRFHHRPDLAVVCGDIMADVRELEAVGPFDAAVSFNVLEHMEDDLAALRAIGKRLRPGGRIGLLVPGGGDKLYGTLDSLDRHFRRYTPARLRTRLEAAGFEVLHIRKLNALGAILWFLKGRVLRSRRFDPGEVRLFDRLVPALRRVERMFGPPFGQSLAAVARRPETPSELTNDGRPR